MIHNVWRHEKTYISSNNNVRKSKRAVEADDGAAPVTILRCAGEAHAEELEESSMLCLLGPYLLHHIWCDSFFPLGSVWNIYFQDLLRGKMTTIMTFCFFARTPYHL
jgi:hypothetical protein